jgi:hypothetical protein
MEDISFLKENLADGNVSRRQHPPLEKEGLLGRSLHGKTHVIMIYVIGITECHRYLQEGLYTDRTRPHRW